MDIVPSSNVQLAERACVAQATTGMDSVRGGQARRLETMGLLAGGLAHDFNNLLTIILSANETLVDRLEREPSSQALARVSLQAAERGSDLVRRLLAFSRQPITDAAPVDAGQAMSAMAPLFKCTIRDGISVKTTVPDAAVLCRADRAELDSALLNLCVNARDALPDGGAIDLEVAQVRLDQRAAEPLSLLPGCYAAFRVKDNGIGMSPNVLRRAREPLFTTKGERGTGFGLSSVSEFAAQSGGALAIESTQGRGTLVTLYLPAEEAAP
jgi:signal transduction histidine kinase